MPGPNISRYLAPQNYSTFYRLVHNYSETILRPCASIAMYADQMIRALNRLPANEQMAAVPVRRAASELHALAIEMSDAVRLFFFPHPLTDFPTLADFDVYYQARWSPFGGDDWDDLLAEFMVMIAPRLEQLSELIGVLELVPHFASEGIAPENGMTVNSAVERSVAQIKLAHHKLTVFLQPEEYDHFVRNPEYFRIKYGF